MNRFNTLLQREWMQHQRGWLALMLVPVALILVAAVFGTVIFDVESDGDTMIQHVPDPLLIAAGAIGAVAIGTLALSWASALFLAPGLSRRDHQDRSIEFWLSLPIGHAQSLATMLLAHLVLVPVLALVAGAAGGFLVALVLVVKEWGLAAWMSLPWNALLSAAGAMALRLGAGVVLATLWLSPLILIAMAASAWFKRWGVPALIAAVVLLGVVMEKLFDSEAVTQVLRGLLRRAGQAFIGIDRDSPIQIKLKSVEDALPLMQNLPAMVLGDFGAALQDLLSPAFVAAMIVAAAGFALLVLRRARGA
ncbi:hypothetical protein HLB44_22610 [Aquincola sp. S2]|uniref:ABC transporter permease n=1 Tax=Pseudaquabacterium terrae TaxID=2732868 RepID=A0ABX2EMK8_9BURK|nr:hypothetical protein [Aquabacterium terrae]NRF69802.1 hypothetical protein [Aquabacterium terrae]